MIGAFLVGSLYGTIYDAPEIIRLTCPIARTQSLVGEYGIQLVCPLTKLIELDSTVYE